MSELKEKIKIKAREQGFDLIAVISPKPIEGWSDKIGELQASCYLTSFLGNEAGKRGNPRELMASVKSIIMLGLAHDDREKADLFPGEGRLAQGMGGIDYHRLLYEKIGALIKDMEPIVPEDFQYKTFVDDKPIAEKALAVRAGFGFIGKNSLLINEKLGSHLYIGGVLTNIDLPADDLDDWALFSSCGQCDKCMRTCPTGAIVEPGVIDTNRCLAQVAQLKGIMPEEYRNKMGYTLYGCDLCQRSCPHNASGKGFNESKNVYNLMEIVEMDNKRFKETLGKTAAGWRGRTTLQRNAIIALGNWGHEQAIPVLTKALNDQREVIRHHAKWALDQIKVKKNT
ncbi:epoxyqueuosine reductase [Desulfitispora alkaliphila]|uniref:tRNA epoxyqueuosine(34) reductase QueG n=1 Tax=Desulfitispora alkaliphila TaxID=622674 RepID=UPI003D24122F